MKSSNPVAMKWAMITALITMISWFILYLTNLYMNQAVSWLLYVVYIIGMVMAMKEFRDKVNGGFMKYGTAFMIGFKVAAITGLASSILGYIMSKWVDPSMMDAIKQKATQDMIAKGLSDAQIDQAMNMTSFFFKPEFILIGGLIGALIFGAILSLIVAAFMKRDDPNAEPTAV